VDNKDNSKAIAAALRQVSRSIANLAALIDGNIPGSSNLIARQVWGAPDLPDCGSL
jgi:transposase